MQFAKLAFPTALLILLACNGRRTEASATAAREHHAVPAVGTTTATPLKEATQEAQPQIPSLPEAEVRIVKGAPPATSELALLMREMADFTDSTRMQLLAGQELLPFPEQFNKLKTAEATPGMVDHNTFDPYAQAWEYHLNKLYEVPKAERTKVFNALVQTCAACHGNMCPGPLVRIRKMGLPEE